MPRRKKPEHTDPNVPAGTKKPKTGEDKRPWSVAAPDGTIVAKMWYKSTADDYAKLMGKGYKAVKVPNMRLLKEPV